ncbi:MAG: c-type cytochrome [Sphingobacteriales bacterium]|nr:MAG: c-type cytochrome [Sphingobacteriales bacterium]
MTNKFLIITGLVGITALAISCSNREPGRAYMPDMTYSKAYETYAPVQERLDASETPGAQFHGGPVNGTIARGDMLGSGLLKDTTGSYATSGLIKNPLAMTSVDMKEAERLYLVNCGICHGTKLDGNGPLWNDSKGPYPAAPKNLMADDMKAASEGTIFHVATYGKGQMGSYASQLSTKQRWMVVAYVKAKQLGAGGTAPAATDSTGAKAPAADTTKAAGK